MNPLLTFLSRHAAQVVVDGLWQGALIAMTVAIVLRLLPEIQAAQRFTLWCAVFTLAVVLPIVPVETRPLRMPGTQLHLGEAWGIALALLWAALVTVRGFRLSLQALRVRKIWQSAVPAAAEATVLTVLKACPRLPELCTSVYVDAPSVIGFFSPRLLIPASMMGQLTEPELLHLVLHECEHLRRYDDWLNLLQKVAVVLFPLNPALLWVDQRLGLERELACDAGVVAATGSPLNYASCLTRLAEHRLGRHRATLALSAWARHSELARRIYSLLQPVRRVSRVGTAVAAMSMVCALLAISIGIVHAPTLVSFSSPVPQAVALAVPSVRSQALPVVFHTTANTTRATYVSATAPVSLRRPAHGHAIQKRQKEHSLRFITASSRRVASQAYLVPVRFSYSFAAVPFGNGWLIVQL